MKIYKITEKFCLNRDGLPNSDHWKTPATLYKKLDAEFHFDFDPCPLHAEFDGLQVEWGNVNFINPPYNRIDKPKFIQKAFDEWRKGKTCVLLIPAATGTKQFHDLILPHAEICFLRGRVAFEGYNTKGVYVTNNKGKHDSMVIAFTHAPNKACTRQVAGVGIFQSVSLSATCGLRKPIRKAQKKG